MWRKLLLWSVWNIRNTRKSRRRDLEAKFSLLGKKMTPNLHKTRESRGNAQFKYSAGWWCKEKGFKFTRTWNSAWIKEAGKAGMNFTWPAQRPPSCWHLRKLWRNFWAKKQEQAECHGGVRASGGLQGWCEKSASSGKDSADIFKDSKYL